MTSPARPAQAPVGRGILDGMSRGTARTAILEATRALVDDQGWAGVRLEAVAARAGVSRQAIYLNFGSRTGLLLALVDWMDEAAGIAPLIERVLAATSGEEQLDRLVELSAEFEPRIRAAAIALDAARHSDPACATVWADRMERRRTAYARTIDRLVREGNLADGLDPVAAVDLMLVMLSPRTHEDLRIERGWTQARYADQMVLALRRLLLRRA